MMLFNLSVKSAFPLNNSIFSGKFSESVGTIYLFTFGCMVVQLEIVMSTPGVFEVILHIQLL